MSVPELAEVEFYRRRWTPGLGQRINRVHLNPGARVVRGSDPAVVQKHLTGAKLTGSFAHGKQMLFGLTPAGWLGVHLGMTGELRAEPPGYEPARHDHLVLFQTARSLVFADPRQFGRLLFHPGAAQPAWWTNRPVDLLSPEFTTEMVEEFLRRRSRTSLKAVLLMQDRFPGVGNWMADEILWRCRMSPATPAGRLKRPQITALHDRIRWVCTGAMTFVAKDHADPPKSWLFQHRWKEGGTCPRDGTVLRRKEIGGRTTCWCPSCQK